MLVSENVLLRPYNTFGINAQARYFSPFADLEQLQTLLQDTRWQSSLRMILGGGSNILFTKNFEGLVLKNELKGISVLREDDDYIYVKAGAGENWHR